MTRRKLNVQPTIKVPAGCKFTVRINRDILFDAPYQPMEANPLPIQPPDQLHRWSGFSTTDDVPITKAASPGREEAKGATPSSTEQKSMMLVHAHDERQLSEMNGGAL